MAKYYTIKEFYTRYNISRSTYYRLEKAGKVFPSKLTSGTVRISLEEIQRIDAMLSNGSRDMS